EITTIKKDIQEIETTKKPEIDTNYLAKLKANLQHLMRQNAGIVRYDADLIKAKEQLLNWKQEIEGIGKTHQINTSYYELLNMITIGYLIVTQSIERHENRGGFVKFESASFVKKNS
ncbi:MAG: hypothetical protein RIR01_1780, partial [Bacteroidota bacterium]